MTWATRFEVGGTAAVLALALTSSAALAQDRVRVTQDRATIWTVGVPTVAAIVSVGTELEVVARRGNWYEVVLPPPTPVVGRTGLIAMSHVVAVTDATPVPTTPSPVEPALPPKAPGAPVSPPPADRAPAPQPPAEQPRRPPAPPPSRGSAVATAPMRFRAFGQLGVGRFLADQSFAAVFDRTGGLWFGGGAGFGLGRRAFVQVSVDRFQRTGERVFVFDDEVFPLGLANRLTLLPITITAGYTFPRRTLVPYVGGGMGRYFLVEASDFADDVEQQFTSYHVVGGVEWRSNGFLGTAVEVQYTHVPGALRGGVAALFEEENLGGVQLRFRVLIGR